MTLQEAYLGPFYQFEKVNEISFFSQLSEKDVLTHTDSTLANSKRVLTSIEDTFKCNNDGYL